MLCRTSFPSVLLDRLTKYPAEKDSRHGMYGVAGYPVVNNTANSGFVDDQRPGERSQKDGATSGACQNESERDRWLRTRRVSMNSTIAERRTYLSVELPTPQSRDHK